MTRDKTAEYPVPVFLLNVNRGCGWTLDAVNDDVTLRHSVLSQARGFYPSTHLSVDRSRVVEYAWCSAVWMVLVCGHLIRRAGTLLRSIITNSIVSTLIVTVYCYIHSQKLKLLTQVQLLLIGRKEFVGYLDG
jgi:hypothetical protein